MATTHGFELLREQLVPEINSTARLCRHAKTGAQLLSIINSDENKVFGATFRTPPSDSTGVAHILEHSVLCGSRKYPVKDPFVQLMKGSLNTFLNAMTFPDKTCYPTASQNLRDFYNLVDVYLDAVFHPRLTREVLQQEGWHYETDDRESRLTYKGVVFNEMKGNYSSPEGMLMEYSQQSLFPNSIYGLDSGGNPKHIPDLTFDQLKSFHERYYHPSNSRLFFYGDDDPTERLRLLDAYLSEFKPIEVSSNIALQPPFASSKRCDYTYAADENTDPANGAMVTVNWMFDRVAGAEIDLLLTVLDRILVGTPAAPLYKALIDSGLGEGIVGNGLDDGLLQLKYSVGLKGINPDDATKVESVILDTLTRLAKGGIESDAVQAALNTTEFRLRESNYGSLPRGIAVMLRSLNSWLYDGDPIEPLFFEAHIDKLKARLLANERVFERLIEQFFLGNNHRSTVLLRPDSDQTRREEAEEQAKLAAVRQAMGPKELVAVVADARALKLKQETPDTPEALATIPLLKLSDLPKVNRTIPLAEETLSGTRILTHDLATNGIIYVDLGFDLHTLPSEMLPYLMLFSRALLETGASGQDFVQLAQRIGRTTGGIRPQLWVSAIRNSPTAAAWLFMRAKVMPDDSPELLAILRDVLLEPKLDDKQRIIQLIMEEKAELEGRVVPAGSSFILHRLTGRLHESGWVNEQISGISYLFFLRELADRVEKDWPSIAANLEQIRNTVVNRAAMICNITSDAANLGRFSPQLAGFLDGLPRSAIVHQHWKRTDDGPRAEGLTIPAKVNYVAKGDSLIRLGYVPNGATSVIQNYLRATWLWEKVRVQGGAYGGYCSVDPRSGVFAFLSYRDPNLLGTLDVYDETSRMLKEIELSDAELSRSIIGTIGDIDAYQLPDAKGYTSMLRYLLDETEAFRQQRREEVLAAGVNDFRAFGEALSGVATAGRVVVLGSSQAIDAASAQRPGIFDQTLKVL
jgi:presequence protease